ncbi:MAG: hypothetical protein AAGH88_13885 [Planctomycetota bacterium]
MFDLNPPHRDPLPEPRPTQWTWPQPQSSIDAARIKMLEDRVAQLERQLDAWMSMQPGRLEALPEDENND